MSLFDRQGRLRHITEVDPWALYVAQASDGEGGVVKVGVTMDTSRRVRDVVSKGGYPVERFVWAWVGTSEWAHRLEAFIHRGFKARCLSGAGFRFDFRSAEDKRLFNGVVQQAYAAVVGRPLKWTSVDLAEVRAELAARKLEGKRKPTVRRMDFTSRSRRP